ncbi:MAG: zinc ABC transporter substrate-binding protein [Deltaproteobacteria bacterium]|nr:zinc ABC transporter substrate-binding protein [Deltaproteobacteria bacterium]
MNRAGFFRFIVFLLGLSLLPGPTGGSLWAASPSPPLITIFCSIGPHLDFCRRIGGKRVRAQLLLEPGKNPATYAPSPAQIEALRRSRFFFSVGLPFEQILLPKIKNLKQGPEIVDTQAGITLLPMADQGLAENHHSHVHNEGLDPHSWLDPRLALQQAANIAAALTRNDPEYKTYYNNNFKILESELNELHKKLQISLHELSGSPLMVYHPAFGYFARAYNLRQIAIEIEGKQPKARDLAQFIQTARENRVRAIFIQPQFDRHSAEKIARAVNCAVVPIDPLAVDYINNLDRIATQVRSHIEPPG